MDDNEYIVLALSQKYMENCFEWNGQRVRQIWTQQSISGRCSGDLSALCNPLRNRNDWTICILREWVDSAKCYWRPACIPSTGGHTPYWWMFVRKHFVEQVRNIIVYSAYLKNKFCFTVILWEIAPLLFNSLWKMHCVSINCFHFITILLFVAYFSDIVYVTVRQNWKGVSIMLKANQTGK